MSAPINVLVVGSGGREHALVWILARSPGVERLFCAPGNGGIADQARCVDVDAMDFDGLIGLCRAESIEFVVVGPEAPLVGGLVERLEAAGITAFGPSAAAAALEGSKGFTKDLCARHGIPSAAYLRCADLESASAYIRRQGAPIVVKADGLAAGKGVIIAQSIDEALVAAAEILDGRFGAAGNELIIEEFLEGEEASFFALVDGQTVLPLASAQDHKAVGEGDTGANTGGMGAYSPAPVVTPEMQRRILEDIIQPTVAAMAAEGRSYRGLLYAGLMIAGGKPKLLEYNVRFGDPECQVLMPRLEGDLLPALLAAAEGRLAEVQLHWSPETALTVVMAARGYPGEYQKGSVIENLNAAGELDGVTIFHAGTLRENGSIRANGGRVLGVTALGASVREAQAKAYEAADVIDWPEGFCRRDIGWRAIARNKD